MSALPADGGRIAGNIMHFARALRAAGLPIGPGKVLDAIQAVQAVGLDSRQDFYWTLHAVFVNRRDQRELFDQAFHIFWRNPKILERMMSLALPGFPTPPDEDAGIMSPRLAAALAAQQDGEPKEREKEIEFDAAMTSSQSEQLGEKDFEKMTAEEVDAARRAIRTMRLPIMEIPTRRFRPDPAGLRADMRATLRASLQHGGNIIALRHRTRRRRRPPLVILCDISGSMDRYARMLIHFMHAVTNDRDRVHTFLFGTRLTNVTRHLRHKDIDVALEKVAGSVADWSGGTRIGKCLADFNRNWSRRVLGQGAVVLFISDGLDRDAGDGVSHEIRRLHGSCRRLVWLNPLLRYDGFEPKSIGVRALLPYVDDFCPVHNLNSLAALTGALNRPGQREAAEMAQWRRRSA
ncbi:MAG: VWA domain-containing protein [Alphaproteobacteria bacterium]